MATKAKAISYSKKVAKRDAYCPSFNLINNYHEILYSNVDGHIHIFQTGDFRYSDYFQFS